MKTGGFTALVRKSSLQASVGSAFHSPWRGGGVSPLPSSSLQQVSCSPLRLGQEEVRGHGRSLRAFKRMRGELRQEGVSLSPPREFLAEMPFEPEVSHLQGVQETLPPLQGLSEMGLTPFGSSQVVRL